MPVQVQVKGPQNGEDFLLFGQDAFPERVFDTEVLDIVDSERRMLYRVPLTQVRFIQPLANPEQPIPQYAGDNRRIRLHIVGDAEGDFQSIGDRLDVTRFINAPMATLLGFMGINEQTKQPDFSREVSVPVENIRYIDFNFIDPSKMEQSDTTEDTQETQEEATQKGSKPTFQKRPRKK